MSGPGGSGPGGGESVSDAGARADDDTGRTLRWAGTRAFLVECYSLADVVALHALLATRPLPGQVDAVAAAETLMLAFTHRQAAEAGARAVRRLGPVAGDLEAGRTVEIDVVYDGEDLAEVGEMTGLGVDGLVRWHTQTAWIGAFGGFAPGFTYLVAEGEVPGGGLPRGQPGGRTPEGGTAEGVPLEIPRRATPRTSVPAGSVAVAGRFSAVYPRVSPGGWQLLGRTDAQMWDLDRSAPALVAPGDRVRYRAVRELVTLPEHQGMTPAGIPAATGTHASAGSAGSAAAAPADARDDALPDTGSALVVERPGLQSLIQDLGRPGHGDLGVVAAGAADAASAWQANRIVGNAPDAAVIETLLGGLALRAHSHLVIALTGAEVCARIAAVPGGLPADRTAPVRAPFALYDGETLEIDEPSAGLRTYVAVRGGLDADVVLGSRSTDTLSGLGPEPLAAGARVSVRAGAGYAAVGSPEPPLRQLPRAGATTELRVVPGPRDDWFGAAGLERLAGQDWVAGTQSNRIGVRLEASQGGLPLERVRSGELASEGAVAGSLQVPPSGLPVLFLADHPVTGGYPVIAVVVSEDLVLAAQLPPGARVCFVPSETVARED